MATRSVADGRALDDLCVAAIARELKLWDGGQPTPDIADEAAKIVWRKVAALLRRNGVLV